MKAGAAELAIHVAIIPPQTHSPYAHAWDVQAGLWSALSRIPRVRVAALRNETLPLALIISQELYICSAERCIGGASAVLQLQQAS